MRIGYVPEVATDLNGILWVNDTMQILMKATRAHVLGKEAQRKKSHTCTRCGDMGIIEVHHIKPIWAWALQAILDYQPKIWMDLQEMRQMVYRQQFNILDCHQLSNLQPLCQRCHVKTGVEIDRQWKNYFTDTYPVVFGIRNMKRMNYLIGMNTE